MTKILQQFTKKLYNLDHFFILNEEKDYYVMGTYITIKEYREITGNLFSFYSENIDKQLPVFFILSFSDNFPKFKEYREHNIPMLILTNAMKKADSDMLQDELDQFIKNKFNS